MRLIISVVFFLSFSTFAMGQSISEADSIGLMCKNDDWNKNWKTRWNKSWMIKDYRLNTATLYSEVTANNVIIQNSYPKGGAYTDSNGQRLGYTIFWTRVVNETDAPLELTMSFPAQTFAILPSTDLYLKLFLPTDTMSFSKQVLYDYGLADLESFLDTNFDMPTMLQRTINPNDESFFYIGALFNHANSVTRAELVLKGQNLFYKVVGPQLDPILIPCGHIIFKE